MSLITSASFTVKARARLQTMLDEKLNKNVSDGRNSAGGGARRSSSGGSIGPDGRVRSPPRVGARKNDTNTNNSNDNIIGATDKELEEQAKQKVLDALNGLSGIRLRKLLVPAMWLRVWRRRRMRAQRDARAHALAIEEGLFTRPALGGPTSPLKRQLSFDSLGGEQQPQQRQAPLPSAHRRGSASSTSYRITACHTLLHSSYAMKAIGETTLRARCTGKDGIDDGAVLDTVQSGTIMMHAFEPVQATGVVVLLSGTMAISMSCREAVGRGPEPGESPTEIKFVTGPAAIFPDRCFTDALLPFFVVARSLCEVAIISHSSIVAMLDKNANILSAKQLARLQSHVVNERQYYFQKNFPQTVTLLRSTSWLVQGLSDPAVEQLINKMMPASFFPNQIIFKAGSPTKEALFLRRGKIEVTMSLSSEQVAALMATRKKLLRENGGDVKALPLDLQQSFDIGNKHGAGDDDDDEVFTAANSRTLMGSTSFTGSEDHRTMMSSSSALGRKHTSVSFADDPFGKSSSSPLSPTSPLAASLNRGGGTRGATSASANGAPRGSVAGSPDGETTDDASPNSNSNNSSAKRTYIFEAPLTLGELGVVLAERRHVTVRALTFVDGWSLPKEGLEHFLVGSKSSSQKIMATAIKTREQWLQSHKDPAFIERALRQWVPGLLQVSDAAIADLISHMQPCVIPARTPIAALSNYCSGLYIIVRGKVAEQRRRKYANEPARFGPARVVGECCALRHRWVVQMCTVTRVDCWALPAGKLAQTLKAHGSLQAVLEECEVRLRELCNAHGVEMPPYRELKPNWSTIMDDVANLDEDGFARSGSGGGIGNDSSDEDADDGGVAAKEWDFSGSRGVPMETHKFEPDVNFGVAAQQQIKSVIRALSETATARQRCIMRALDAVGLVSICDVVRIRTPPAVRRRREMEARMLARQRDSGGGGGGGDDTNDSESSSRPLSAGVAVLQQKSPSGSAGGAGVGVGVGAAATTVSSVDGGKGDASATGVATAAGRNMSPPSTSASLTRKSSVVFESVYDDPAVARMKALNYAAALLGGSAAASGPFPDGPGVSGQVIEIPAYRMLHKLPLITLCVETAEQMGKMAPWLFAVLQRPAVFEGVMEGSGPGPFDVLLGDDEANNNNEEDDEEEEEEEETEEMDEDGGTTSSNNNNNNNNSLSNRGANSSSSSGSTLKRSASFQRQQKLERERKKAERMRDKMNRQRLKKLQEAKARLQQQQLQSAAKKAFANRANLGGSMMAASANPEQSINNNNNNGADVFAGSDSPISALLAAATSRGKRLQPATNYRPHRPNSYDAMLPSSALAAEKERRRVHAEHDRAMKEKEEALAIAREKALRMLRHADLEKQQEVKKRTPMGRGGADRSINGSNGCDDNNNNNSGRGGNVEYEGVPTEKELAALLTAEVDLVEKIEKEAPAEVQDAALREDEAAFGGHQRHHHHPHHGGSAGGGRHRSQQRRASAAPGSGSSSIDYKTEYHDRHPPSPAVIAAAARSREVPLFQPPLSTEEFVYAEIDRLVPKPPANDSSSKHQQQQPGTAESQESNATQLLHRKAQERKGRLGGSAGANLADPADPLLAEINEILPEELHDCSWEVQRLRAIQDIAHEARSHIKPQLPMFKVRRKNWRYVSRREREREEEEEKEKQKKHQQQQDGGNTTNKGGTSGGGAAEKKRLGRELSTGTQSGDVAERSASFADSQSLEESHFVDHPHPHHHQQTKHQQQQQMHEQQQKRSAPRRPAQLPHYARSVICDKDERKKDPALASSPTTSTTPTNATISGRAVSGAFSSTLVLPPIGRPSAQTARPAPRKWMLQL